MLVLINIFIDILNEHQLNTVYDVWEVLADVRIRSRGRSHDEMTEGSRTVVVAVVTIHP